MIDTLRSIPDRRYNDVANLVLGLDSNEEIYLLLSKSSDPGKYVIGDLLLLLD